jgi:hypothetical protein
LFHSSRRFAGCDARQSAGYDDAEALSVERSQFRRARASHTSRRSDDLLNFRALIADETMSGNSRAAVRTLKA